MKLHVIERVKLMAIIPFPKEGNRMAFKIIDDLQKELSFSEKEYKEFKIKEDKTTGQISWENGKEKEIEIGEIANEIICEALRKLDKAGKFDVFYYRLSQRFDIDKPQIKKDEPVKIDKPVKKVPGK